MIVVIAGATATGKTQISQKLAKEFNGYILNGDSRQVYKELNIGTAKPTPEEIEESGVEHRLFGHVSINEEYNLYRYQKEAKEVLKEKEKKKLKKEENAFIVGGTGLYIDSVVYNYKLKETPQREDLENLSLKELQERVGDDLKNFNESDSKNPRRLMSFLQRGKRNFEKGKPLNHIYIVLDKDFETIEQNIQKRIEKMFKEGLLEENLKLFEQGLHHRVSTIGYSEFRDFFDKKITLEEVKERIFLNTRQYAKRQITWFRRNKNAKWAKDYEEIHSIVLEGIE